MTLSLVNSDGYRWDHCGDENEMIKAELTWKFKISYLKTPNQYMKRFKGGALSPFFNANVSPDHKWRLQVDDNISRLHITLLHFDSQRQETIIGHPAVIVKFAIIDIQGQKRFKNMFLSAAKSKSVEFKLIKDEIINSRCQPTDGSIIIYCKIKSIVKKGREFSFAEPVDLSDQLLSQLETMLGDGKYCDVTFVLREREYKAHKNILASRSKVFEAMFKQKTKDILNNPIVIEDIEPEVFQVLLRFIYTGKVFGNDIEKFATELYVAADEYQLDQLKSSCENFLIRRPMSADYCIESFLFISNHPSVEKLKQKAIHFFRLYPMEVMETEGWNKAKNENKPWLSGILKFLLHPADSAVQFPVKVVNEQSSSTVSYSDESLNANLINTPVDADAEEKGGSNDLLCWRECGLSGPSSVSQEKTRDVDVTVSDNIQQKSNLNGNCHKVLLTLQDYRKQVAS